MPIDVDQDLLDRWRAGDQAAGRDLFARYFDQLYRFFSNKSAEPDEMVQSTLLAMVKSRDQFAGRSSFRTYVFTIARHVLHRQLRTIMRERDFDPALSSIAEIATSIRSRLAREADHKRLCEALQMLSVENQTLLELHYWEGLDADALAEIFEVENQTIRTRLSRARAALRERMSGDDEALLTFRP